MRQKSYFRKERVRPTFDSRGYARRCCRNIQRRAPRQLLDAIAMTFSFTHQRTRSVLSTNFFASVIHPSLPPTAATGRTVVKDALKNHKRLAASSQDRHLSTVQDALNAYIPYLLVLSTTSSYRDVGSDHVDLQILRH